ncbi:23S rRNA (guanosine(2251)-2'-O)-methyltransferase RlmB [Zavarzinia compransoris]|uniref:23S rRNA (Guanosine(2251)-2'-O)-methyltransferase RlmB n=1 Tax=Zavarzinia compransoris TaxID=1264899 RepID=A0A317DX68_9PROT|nr:23S rRNA (guanosine(2251)-2'-O)-methyltransferase RlmB [Zavarzinia compransoris]PWR19052.1 23S rRNA (guanosine(2251)-2'-O)-methyltransferase RlmB [Zavarzinia compransoris]TDP49059.1 23S rRNA (guanosine2251-2'-O)-methyltransferase [Zavarzinia compransoris]
MDKRRPASRGPGGKGPAPQGFKGPAPQGGKGSPPQGFRDKDAGATGAGPKARPGKPAGPRPGSAAKPAAPARPAREGGLWLYGHHPVLAALENPARRCLRLVTSAEHPDEIAPALQRAIEAKGVAVEHASRDALERLLPAGSVHQGIALKVEPLEELSLDEACVRDDGERAIVVVLDQVTDPHNVGAILRSAAAFGARAVVVTDRHAPGATAVMAKSASGALDVIPLVRVVNLARALDQLGEMGYWRIALDADAPATLAATDTTGSIALVLGAEGLGLRRLTRERCDTIASLPIKGMESLNVSNAAAVALYELIRVT